MLDLTFEGAMNDTTNRVSSLPIEKINLAANYLNDILLHAIQFSSSHVAIVVYDAQSELSVALTAAYRQCLPDALFVDFYELSPEEVLAVLATLKPEDLVVLIQSTSFRLDAFRLRIELFQRGLKVIEHPHLSGMIGKEALYYLDSLAYDPAYFRGVGHALKKVIDSAASVVIDSGQDSYLVYDAGFEPAKLNIGDYTEMKNIGGQFPIGEVFTEARDLEAVNGRVRIHIFGDTAFKVNKPDHFITLVIAKGRVIDVLNSTAEFDKVLANIRADEGDVWVRELGLGLNRAFSMDRIVSDIGTYERVCGVHLSLGAKHSVYKKPQFRTRDTRHHVDVFVAAETVAVDNQIVFEQGAWQIFG
jgi:aminopeptidase